MTDTEQQLALSAGLTVKTKQLCLGLESGAADILELVTPTTADLLAWWFGEDMVMARGGEGRGLNFHAGQKQAILNAFVDHEVLGAGHESWTLLDLYRAAALDALLIGTRLNEVSADKHGHPKYCLKMATGTGKTWVLLALMIWQLLNKTAALAEGDVTEDIEEVETLGAPLDPQDVVTQVLPLMPGRATGNSLDVLDRRYARGNVLEFLAQLPELMVFNDEAHHIHEFKREGETTEVEWQKSLSRIAQTKCRRFVQLEFKAERDESGNPALSEGQRVMLRAGLAKLRKLEKDFATIDPHRHPKMLVVCEDTTVSPLVAEFLRDQEGLSEDEVMTIDSGKKAELGEKDWAPVRERLFSVDHHATPRVIVSVLMLREGFDVNNICVIVPLRSSQAQILLEQTIGRGLRLMWRDPEYNDIKRENRELIKAGKEPGSLLDVLSIVEHPAFQSFYDELINEGLAGTTGDDDGNDTSATGDVIAAELRDHNQIDVTTLPAFTAMTADQLKVMLGKGDIFVSQDLQSAMLFGDYRVDGAVMNVSGYNDYLSRLTRRISQALSEPLPKGNKIATHLAKPYLQVNTAELTGWIDDYIWTQLFEGSFNPLGHDEQGENWRLLLLSPVVDHIHWAQADTQVLAFCKISENRHTFARLRYVKDDGLPAFYSPDFLVRTAGAVYLVETKGQEQTIHPNEQRKLKAALAWCERINNLTEDQRGGPPWHYVLLGEAMVYEWQGKGARLADLLNYAKLRPLGLATLPQQLI